VRRKFLLAALVPLAVALAGCSPLTIVNRLAPSSTYTLSAHIAYGPEARDKLDVYRPRETAQRPAPRGGFPVVVFFYGGSWNTGERGDYRFVGEALASQGIVAVVADYRLYPQVRYPDFLTDSALAVAWAKREALRYGGDPSRLFVMGHSSGAYNAAMVALDPRWLAAAGLAPSALAGWIGLAGPYDFLPIENKKAQPVFFHPNYPPGSQPIDYVSSAAPRTFLGAAASDDIVNPQRNSRQMEAKLRAAGVPVTLKIYPRANHYTLIGSFARPLRGLEPVLDDVGAFVRGDVAAP
jgi:acetyl esterase/lipase